MKPNEAPENIYVSNYSSGLTYNWHNERLAVNDIEYTRTDAFIEKAKKWFEEHFGNRLKWEITTYEFKDMQSMVEDFRNYMGGE